MEDTKEKLRRNLVGFSALYLAAAFLKINPVVVITWLPGSLKDVSPLRLQILSIIFLIYLSFRWFTSSEHVSAFSRLRDIWIEKMKKNIQPLVEREMVKVLASTDDLLGERYGDFKRSYNVIVHEFGCHSNSVDVIGWMRDLKISGSISVADKGSDPFAARSFEYLTRQTNVGWIFGHLLCAYYALKTEYFWEWIVPIVLAYATLWVMVWRIADYSLARIFSY